MYVRETKGSLYKLDQNKCRARNIHEGTEQRIKTKQHKHTLKRMKRSQTKQHKIWKPNQILWGKIPITVCHTHPPPHKGLHSVPECGPWGSHTFPFEMLGFLVSWILHSLGHDRQMFWTHTHISVYKYLVLFSLHCCSTKFLCRTMFFWLMLDWTLSQQVGRKLKIILFLGLKPSGRWHDSFGKPRVHFDQGAGESTCCRVIYREQRIHLLNMIPSAEVFFF